MKKFYAVQVGDDYDWDNGSEDYNEAMKIAEREHENNPGEEIRIATIDVETNYCEDCETVFEA